MAVSVFIGMGSNLGDLEGQLDSATVAIASLPETELLNCAPRYRSPAIGPGPQPDYLNTVLVIATSLGPVDLLDKLQQIEQRHQRVAAVRWGPRTLDLDILLYGQDCIQLPRLTVPHPRLKDRSFVVYPLHDIAPNLVLPDGTQVAHLLAKSSPQGIVRLSAGESRGSTG